MTEKYDANGMKIAEPPPNLRTIEWANRKLFEKYCKAEGIDPAKTVTSPILVKLIAQQNEESRRARAMLDEQIE